MNGWRLLGLILLVLPVPSSASPPPLSDDSVGPTCRDHLSVLGFPWQHELGDWRDRRGRLHGSEAYAQQTVAPMPGVQLLSFDVGELVTEWFRQPQRNQGLLLRALPDSPGGTVDFHSREAANGAWRPELKLEWADGTRSRLQPVADTYLDCSSLSSLGERPLMKVGPRQNALLRFVLPAGRQAVQRATLLLSSGQQYGRGTRIGVFKVETPALRPAEVAPRGLAARYPLDRGIEKDPAVLMATGFEELNWRGRWTTASLRSQVDRLEQDPQDGTAAPHGQMLKTTLRKGENLALDLRYEFAKAGVSEPEELYFRYYLRFAPDWNPSHDGGKMPGFAGTYGRAGWGMRKSDGRNGWSARGAFFARPRNAKGMEGLTALGTYAYHADIADASGEVWPWGGGAGALLENGRWYCVEQHLRLNKPGLADGQMRVWVDGREVLNRQRVRFRHVPELKIEAVWFDVYHGGVAPAPHDMTLYIDQVVIAREYIGPLSAAGEAR